MIVALRPLEPNRLTRGIHQDQKLGLNDPLDSNFLGTMIYGGRPDPTLMGLGSVDSVIRSRRNDAKGCIRGNLT